jgi:NADH-quinone oxidoreductase subunit G
MVVHTQTARVRQAQEAVVEFLLINHPLDCPVCDKGGECPLQDISFGWGGGRSRFIEPKRHFVKPLALSPLIAIDRERCILCYRCVRFSQEISEDYQLVLQERGAHSYVATFDGHPYVAPFSGNIIELCPVGALTSQPYRFRARPWDIEGAGSVCTLCPAQCNVTFTVRDERVLRVLARDHPEVDDGWLCDKGRFAYQSVHVDERVIEPMVRDGGELRAVSWERALQEAISGLRRAGAATAALAGGEATNEEGFLLQRLLREGLGSNDLDSRLGNPLPRDLHAALHDPALQASVPDLEFAHAVLVFGTEPVDDAPILDLRIRKGVRRHGVTLAVATSRPSSLDSSAKAVVRYAPGAEEAFALALNSALGDGKNVDELADAAGASAQDVRALARLLVGAGEDVVILWGERLTGGPRNAEAARALLNVAGKLVERARDGAGLIAVPATTNGRGLREVGVLPNAGPGLAMLDAEGRGAPQIAAAGAAGEVAALYLLRADPLLTHAGRARWTAALDRASTVIAHAEFLTEGIREYATVVFPAESYAEKEGTVTHPDGRVQRLRPAIGRPGSVRAEWQVLADVAGALGVDLRVLTGSMATKQTFDAVAFYAGLTLDELAGRGVRWPAREQASAWPPADAGPFGLAEIPPGAPLANGRLRLGTYRSIWAAPEVQYSPALRFVHPRRVVELSEADAQRLNVFEGERVMVEGDGHGVEATVAVRAGSPPGAAFMEIGSLDGPLVEVRKVR